jgi:hypothetical protein
LISLAVGFLWEIYEFSFDTFFGTDMQKTIPEGVFFNGGNSFADLHGSDANSPVSSAPPKATATRFSTRWAIWSIASSAVFSFRFS